MAHWAVTSHSQTLSACFSDTLSLLWPSCRLLCHSQVSSLNRRVTKSAHLTWLHITETFRWKLHYMFCLWVYVKLLSMWLTVFQTTLAHIIASTSKRKGTARFVTLSATSTSTNEVREVIKQAQNELRLCKRKTILFIDEIHRFNKSQQVRRYFRAESCTLLVADFFYVPPANKIVYQHECICMYNQLTGPSLSLQKQHEFSSSCLWSIGNIHFWGFDW